MEAAKEDSELNEFYYHSCPVRLGANSIIMPGNYGRIINKIGVAHPLYEREVILERCRAVNFPEKPSRYTTAYVCTNLDDVLFFRRHQGNHNLIYKVRIIDNTRKFHIGCFNCMPGIRHIKTSEEIANDYWLGKKIFVQGYEHLKFTELLTESPLEVLELMEE